MEKKIDNKQGFTLIEVVVGIALLGIIIISFMPVFSNSFKGITNSGKKSNALYSSQEGIEKKLHGGTDINSTDTPKRITIKFSGAEFDVNGKAILTEIPFGNNGNKTIVKSFKPD
ncbi:prepilin-type N-terminal cleavage/methylation domain-containing protein [Clostridium estertheticum]|nr:prepilin-type N-terminal cleavage/methylation domain-containing protein [Clostridium estertheticum]WAG72320.1 prepilin-type N-terminal cleavage/methylation domain-containing protein [Clostridium estertheticum]